jgi:hypothetical protein
MTNDRQPDQCSKQRGEPSGERDVGFRACPVCGGELVEIRQKRVCSRCHTICETCCEGGRG